jgi:hypothetical protein
MSRLTDLALKDAEECLSKSSLNLYQIKIAIESTMRNLQEECSLLNSLVNTLQGETDEEKEANSKLLAKLNSAVEINRKMYTENMKALDQVQLATTLSSRADRWIGAVAEDLKK